MEGNNHLLKSGIITPAYALGALGLTTLLLLTAFVYAGRTSYGAAGALQSPPDIDAQLALAREVLPEREEKKEDPHLELSVADAPLPELMVQLPEPPLPPPMAVVEEPKNEAPTLAELLSKREVLRLELESADEELCRMDSLMCDRQTAQRKAQRFAEEDNKELESESESVKAPPSPPAEPPRPSAAELERMRRESIINSPLSEAGAPGYSPTAAASYWGEAGQAGGAVLSDNARSRGYATVSAYEALRTGDFVLNSQVVPLKGPYVLQQGAKLRAVLNTSINSDLPGEVYAQVIEDAYDSVNGRYLLVPRGSRLHGQYGAQAPMGMKRVFIGFDRLIFPNGDSIALGIMPAYSASGSGFEAEVDNHFMASLTSCLMMAAIGTGSGLAEYTDSKSEGYNVGTTYAAKSAESGGQAGNSILERNVNLAPTLSVDRGYIFEIPVNKDIYFDAPYRG